MGRKNRQLEIEQAIMAYLEQAAQKSPEEAPINKSALASAIGVSRPTIHDPRLFGGELQARIDVAIEQQRQNTLKNKRKRRRDEEVTALKEAVREADERYKRLLAHIHLIEANAVRLNIDVEELYRPILKPVRSVPHTITKGGRRGRRQHP